MSPDPDPNEIVTTPVVDTKEVKVEGTDEKSKTVRHPRWTRRETLILIEGKRVAEDRGRKGGRYNSGFGSDQPLLPKWDAVSSFCRDHGVSRGPVQCRKRWSNLVGDFRRVKAWESGLKDGASESFWKMMNDSRKENKLPTFFDKEVYDVLEGRAFTATAYPLTLVDAKTGGDVEETLAAEEEAEAVSDGRGGPVPPEKQPSVTSSPANTVHTPSPTSGATKKRGSSCCGGPTCEEECKRGRLSFDGEGSSGALEERLIEILEKNSRMVNTQLEAQNMRFQLDREQRNEQNKSLIAALSKLTDQIGRIADKL